MTTTRALVTQALRTTEIDNSADTADDGDPRHAPDELRQRAVEAGAIIDHTTPLRIREFVPDHTTSTTESDDEGETQSLSESEPRNLPCNTDEEDKTKDVPTRSTSSKRTTILRKSSRRI